jgi:hypothetical protein
VGTGGRKSDSRPGFILAASNGRTYGTPSLGPARGNVCLKVSEKGGLSVYGLWCFPDPIYREQGGKLRSMAGEIRAFIRAKDHSLKKKE